MNDQDKLEKLQGKEEKSNDNGLDVNPMAGDGPSRKRLRKDSAGEVRNEAEVNVENQNESVST